jgi:uncharacterized protein with HEPN domain
MHARAPKLLEDIRDAAAFIEQATADRSEADYGTDRVLRQAVERSFEVIGEAVKRLAQVDAATAQQITHFERMISFRNVLIHGYDLIDHALVWSTVQHQLPVLLAEVSALLGRGESTDA